MFGELQGTPPRRASKQLLSYVFATQSNNFMTNILPDSNPKACISFQKTNVSCTSCEV